MRYWFILLFVISGFVFGQKSALYNSFNGGVLSPLAKDRVDLEKRQMGQQELDNMLVKQQGGVIRRPGTELVNEIPIEVCFPNTAAYPMLHELDASEIPAKPSAPTIADGTTPVSNATELQAMNGANSYILTADIDLTGVVWTPITNFSGTLDGDGHTISNLTINSAASDNQGLFGTVATNCKIKDLILSDFSITGDDKVGGLIGNLTANTIIILNVSIVNSSINADTYGGGLIGYISGYNLDIFQCFANATNVSCNSTNNLWMGGLIGSFNVSADGTTPNNIVDCYTTGGTITGKERVGGFVGDCWGRFNSASAQDTNIHSCYSMNSVEITLLESTSFENIGGFVGGIGVCQITNCYATGNITWNNPDVALYGYSSGNYIGGFAGIIYQGDEETQAGNSYIINCYSVGNITVIDTTQNVVTLVGGFCGKSDIANNHILRCYSTGNITITLTEYGSMSDIGGFSGAWRGTPYSDLTYQTNTSSVGSIKRCWCTGDISLSDAGDCTVGGFVGDYTFHPPLTENCYTWSEISVVPTDTFSTGFIIGGFVGKFPGNSPPIIENCYVAQTNSRYGSGITNGLPNSALAYIGGFVGRNVHQENKSVTITQVIQDVDGNWGKFLATSHGLTSDGFYGLKGIGAPDTTPRLSVGQPQVDNFYIVRFDTNYLRFYRYACGNVGGYGSLEVTSGAWSGSFSISIDLSIDTQNCFFDYETAGTQNDDSTSTASPQTTEIMMTKTTYTNVGWQFSTEDLIKDDINSIWYMPVGGETCYSQDGAAEPTRLIPFEYSTTDAYVLAFGNHCIGFFENGAQIQQ